MHLNNKCYLLFELKIFKKQNKTKQKTKQNQAKHNQAKNTTKQDQAQNKC
jgi:hypothetical protein